MLAKSTRSSRQLEAEQLALGSQWPNRPLALGKKKDYGHLWHCHLGKALSSHTRSFTGLESPHFWLLGGSMLQAEKKHSLAEAKSQASNKSIGLSSSRRLSLSRKGQCETTAADPQGTRGWHWALSGTYLQPAASGRTPGLEHRVEVVWCQQHQLCSFIRCSKSTGENQAPSF